MENISCQPSNFTCEAIRECHDYYFLAEKYYCGNPTTQSFLIYNVGIIFTILVLLLILSLVISNYMFVNLHSLTDSIRIGPKFLYFIIIPLLNSFGDIINYYNGLRVSTELVLGQLIGSNLIIVGLTMGLICVVKPFSIRHDKRIVYDLLWLLDVFILVNFIIYDGKITKLESLVMAVVYLFHLLYLFKSNQSESNEHLPLNIDEELESLEQLEESENVPEPLWLKTLHGIVHGVNVMINVMVPLDCPPPLLYYYYAVGSGLIFYKFPSIFTVIILGIIFAAIYYIDYRLKVQTSHMMNGMGLVNSMVLVSIISQLLLQIVKNYGLILKLSDYLLGFLVFSIMNSINDIVTNVSLSIKYSPILGLNACLGTPLLLILVGLGYNSLVLNKELTFSMPSNFKYTARGLVLIMTVLMVIVPLKWKFSRGIGVFLLLSWLSLSIMNCILE